MKNKLITVAIAMIALAGCQQETGDTAKEPLSGIIFDAVDSTTKPGDDFFYFVNGKWVANTEIPADKSSYSIGTELYEKSQEDVKKIIEEAASSNPAAGTDEQKVGDLYASYMDLQKRNTLGVAPLQEEFNRIDAIRDLGALSSYFGYSIKYSYDNPFAMFIDADLKKPDTYALYVFQGGLGLPEREYYLEEKTESKDIRKAYVAHVAKMLQLAGIANGEKAANEILALETKIARNHIPKEETRDMNKMYNMRTVDSLDNAMANVDWKALLAEVGMPKLEKLVVGQPTFMAGMDKLMAGTSLDTWKNYCKWQVIHANATRLSEEIDKENFAFYGTKLNGTPQQTDLWRRAVNTVNGNLGEVVGKIYVGKHFPPEAKARMVELVGNLTRAYEASIKELDWMSAETKIAALEKLSKFTAKIGYPDTWKDYSALEVKRDDLYGNLRRATLVEHERQIAKFDKPVDKSEWLMTPQTINAYYNPTNNEIAFPAAILQPPFFNMEADDAVNYGAIGGVIGHEIGHGFDDQGSTFDGDGVLRDWWTTSDKEEFKKRTSALVDQYNSFQVFDDLKVNGEYTLGENIGDLGGLSIALKAYKMSLNGQEEKLIDGLTGTQRVFLGWAQAWKGKSRDEALRVQVGTDPHSPRQFRVNGVVRNIPEFYEAFDVKPGDSLYLEPEKRVKIW